MSKSWEDECKDNPKLNSGPVAQSTTGEVTIICKVSRAESIAVEKNAKPAYAAESGNVKPVESVSLNGNIESNIGNILSSSGTL
jgi:hypothetical protein